jgi:hypothetical protein
MKKWTLLFALTLAAAPAAAHAQQQGNDGRMDRPRAGARQGERPGGRFGASPLQFLERHSAELKLDANQLQRVKSRDEQLQAANRPLLEKLQAARGQRGAQAQVDREAMRQRMQELRPTMEQMRKNSEAAWKDALSYLTKDQANQAEQLRKSEMQQRRQGRAQAGDRRESGAQGRGAWQGRGGRGQGGV